MLGTPSRNRLAERREAVRREILDAAWAVARERGLAELTLREVAERVGMRTPSLYSHFDSKSAIYDAMFGQAWTECVAGMEQQVSTLPRSPRARLRRVARAFFEFSVEDVVRFQLMNQRVIVGFEPSPESYAPSLRAMQMLREVMAGVGIRKETDIDLYVALVGGLADCQLANDPGGRRYERLLDRAINMYADEVGLPRERRAG